jgi:hypothetical protein
MNITKQRVALAIGTCGLLAAAGCAGATATKTVAPTSAAAAPSSPAEGSAPAAGGKTMYDTQYPSIVPKSADLVASYVDGPQASNFDQAQQIFGSKALSITWTGEPADIADVEGGFAMSKLPEWIKQQQDAGIPKPVIYAIYSGVGTNYQQVKKAVGSAKVSWWLSDWTGKPHTLPGADAVQYGAQASPSSPMITDPSQAGGHTYDLSFVSSSFPYYGGAPHLTPAKAPAAPAAHAGGTRGTGAAPAPVISVGAPGGACGGGSIGGGPPRSHMITSASVDAPTTRTPGTRADSAGFWAATTTVSEPGSAATTAGSTPGTGRSRAEPPVQAQAQFHQTAGQCLRLSLIRQVTIRASPIVAWRPFRYCCASGGSFSSAAGMVTARIQTRAITSAAWLFAWRRSADAALVTSATAVNVGVTVSCAPTVWSRVAADCTDSSASWARPALLASAI